MINCKNGLIITQKNSAFFEETVRKSGTGIIQRSFNEHKKFINNGYNVFHRVHEVFINDSGNLSLDYNELNITDGNTILFQTKKDKQKIRKRSTPSVGPNTLKSNPNLWLRKYTWSDGSTAIIDANGLLHLKSADNKLPEITIVMVLDKPTTCWASNGFICGSEYFTGSSGGERILTIDFILKFILPFGNNLP